MDAEPATEDEGDEEQHAVVLVEEAEVLLQVLLGKSRTWLNIRGSMAGQRGSK